MDREQPRDVVLVTGQTGIGINDCLSRLVQVSDGALVHLETRSHLNNPKFLGKHITWKKQPNFLQFLTAPPPVMSKVWSDAFRQATQQLPDVPSPSKTHMVSFHGCHYNQMKREFLYPIDLKALEEMKTRVKCVVVLIDDCFDIHDRLILQRKMFNEDWVEATRTEDKKKIVQRLVWDLLLVLIWRDLEIALSRLVADFIGVRLFVVSVKHPRSVVVRLFTRPLDDVKFAYLSHAITSVRDMAGDSIATHPYPSEVNHLYKGLIERSDDLVLFLPDTIDEYRVCLSDNGPSRVQARWPLPLSGDWLCQPSPATSTNSIDYLDGLSEDDASGVKLLLEHVKKQIASRDRSLVEQSTDRLLVYRPTFDGHISGGVDEEVKYSKVLRDCQDSIASRHEYAIKLFENPIDAGKCIVLVLVNLLRNLVIDEDEPSVRQLLTDMRQEMIADLSLTRALGGGLLAGDEEKTRIEIAKLVAKAREFISKRPQEKEIRYSAPPSGALGSETMAQCEASENAAWKQIEEGLQNYSRTSIWWNVRQRGGSLVVDLESCGSDPTDDILKYLELEVADRDG